ncbi:MAG: YeeE/YedE thiosulfate transporter family protein [Brevefilum sp.]
MAFLTQVRWSPYVVGVGIGVVSWLSFLILKKPFGCSTPFAKTSGMIEKFFRGPDVGLKPYYRKFKPEIDWQWMLVLGIVFGALTSAILSGDFAFQWVPALWLSAFGNTPVLRVLTAVIGGVLIGFGARWANGCTSGHGINGALQLAVSSWISGIAFFIGGILAAHVLFRLIAG